MDEARAEFPPSKAINPPFLDTAANTILTNTKSVATRGLLSRQTRKGEQTCIRLCPRQPLFLQVPQYSRPQYARSVTRRVELPTTPNINVQAWGILDDMILRRNRCVYR